MSKPESGRLRGVYDVARASLPPLEFALRAPSGSSHVFLYALTALLAVSLGLASVIRVPVTLSFPGVLALETPPTRVDATSDKRIRRVRVREGDRVAKGDLLLEVRGVLADTESRALSLFAEELRGALDSETAGTCRSDCIGNLRRLARDGAPNLTASSPRELVARTVAALEEYLAARVESGGADAGLLALSRRREQTAARLKALGEARVDLRFEREQLEAELTALDAELRGLESKSRAGMGRAFSRIDSASRELQAYVRGQFENVYVRSPVDGYVLRVHVGGVDEIVAPGTPLVDVSPEGVFAVAELSVPSRDVARLEEGHAVALAIDAFPVHKFGLLDARVESLPRVAEPGPPQGGASTTTGPTFKVVARPQTQGFTENGRDLPLRAGMTLLASYELRRERPIVLLYELLAGTGSQ
jgi:multidrug resistance efflux pump